MKTRTIAIIDDDPFIGDMLEEVLHKQGYRTLRAYSGTEALLLISQQTPDLILLDLMLPGLSGEALLPHLTGIPVIVLSAKGELENKVNLLLEGAADYITKPFHTEELLARITVQLRKPSAATSPLLTWEDITLNSALHSVTAAGQEVHVTKTELAILKQLLLHPHQILTKSALLDQISYDTPDCTENSLKIHVSNLRKKLREATGKEYIEAVWGIGFKLSDPAS